MLAEQADSMVTCQAIIQETMELGLDIDVQASQAERKNQSRQIWLDNVEACIL